MTDVAFELVTSTDFSEYFPNFFAGQIDGCYFGAQFIPEEKQIYLTMGISSLTTVTKNDLLARVRASTWMNEETLRFEDHSVCGRVPVFDAEWSNRFKGAVTLLSEWAAANQISSGCFLCGKDDLTVLYRNDDHRNAYICDECLASPPNLYAKEIEQMQVQARQSAGFENRWRGIFLTFLVRAIISLVWIPLMITGTVTSLAAPMLFVVPLIIPVTGFVCYRLFSGAFTSLGKWITTAILVVFCLLEYVIGASSIISENVNRLFPNIQLTGIDVFLFLPEYLTSPGLKGSMIVFALLILPLFGIIFIAVSHTIFSVFEQPRHES